MKKLIATLLLAASASGLYGAAAPQATAIPVDVDLGLEGDIPGFSGVCVNVFIRLFGGRPIATENPICVLTP